MLHLINELEHCWLHKEKAVIATIINTEGSTYRQTGAKSIFYENGNIIGVLSGGCVEGDIFEYCKTVMRTGEPQIINYDLRDEDALWGLGVGCDGGLTIFLQLFDPEKNPLVAHNILLTYRKSLTSPEPYRLVTVTRSGEEEKISAGSVWDYNDFMEETDPSKVEDYTLFKIKALSKEEGKPFPVECFMETIQPTPKIVIFGAGSDAVPVTQLAKNLGWHVSLVDHRPEYLTREKFPHIDRFVHISSPGDMETLDFEGDVSVVIMSHHFEKDLFYLEKMLSKNLTYLGVLGARQRTRRLMESLERQGTTFPSDMSNLHYPVGLDVGAETPEEIALSILAEMLKVKNGRNGSSLHLKAGSIHGQKMKVLS
ncbi:XdhC family protein [Alteribacillus sp. JSM 102045]|uniref:XdhC family protein n=1 Tax=Alteribacillus sp. JSM 102045 TaxID=1562101 RepID=UPI0035C13DCD